MQSAGREHSEQLRLEALQCIQACKDGSLDQAQEQAKMAEAWKLLEESINAFPANNRARFLVVSCAMAEDKFERAKYEGTQIFKSLSMKQRQEMGDAALHLSLAHVSKMLGEIDDAIMYAAEAAKLFPSDPHPHMILGELYEAHGSAEDAERECREALRFQGDQSSCEHALKEQSVYFTLCCLAASLSRQKRYTEAERFLAQAVNLDNTSTLALRYLVDVYQHQGLISNALELARKLEEHDPDDEYIRGKIDEMVHGQRAAENNAAMHSDRGLAPSSEFRDVRDRDRRGAESDALASEGRGDSARGRPGSSVASLDGRPRRVREAALARADSGERMISQRKQGGGLEGMMCCCFDRGPGEKPKR